MGCRSDCERDHPASEDGWRAARSKCRKECRKENNYASSATGASKLEEGMTRLCDIKFGDMNSGYLFSSDSLEQKSIDPRRTNSLFQIGAAINDNITPDLSKNVSKPPPQIALILRSQGNSHPWVQNKSQQLAARFGYTGIKDGDKQYFKYKVWVAEQSGAQECPPSVSLADGPHQAHINMALDAYPTPGSFGERVAFPPGTFVYYEGDPSVGPITLTTPTRQQILLPGGELDADIYSKMASEFAYGATAKAGRYSGEEPGFFRTLRDSGYFPEDEFSDEFLAGLVANINYESGMNSSAMGPTDGFAEGKQPTGGKKCPILAEGGSYYCAFGYIQMYTCSFKGRAEGATFLEWAASQQTEAEGGNLNSQTVRDCNHYQPLLNKLLNHNAQLKFIAYRSKMIFRGDEKKPSGVGPGRPKCFHEESSINDALECDQPNGESAHLYSAYYWGYTIAHKFIKCSKCTTWTNGFSAQYETERRGFSAARLYRQMHPGS